MPQQHSLALHHHGKSRVRVGRVWREGDVHHLVEWNVYTMIDSPMENAFINGDNAGMTPTDTQKNVCYVVAKKLAQRATVEEYAVALAKFLVNQYPLVSKAKVYVEQKPWQRVPVHGVPHNHAFAVTGTEIRTASVTFDKQGNLEITGGMKDLQVAKTTESGYVGFLRCPYTILPEVTDRIAATSVTANWRLTKPPRCWDATYAAVRNAFIESFFGPAKSGVYSPSVQYTLYQMANLALDRVEEIDSVFLNMPNLHFMPVNPVGSKFEDDVFAATSEPHGNIEAVVTRKNRQPHVAKL